MTRTRKPHRFPRSMPWWRSQSIMSWAVAGVALTLKQSGLPQESIGEWTDWLLLVTTAFSGGVGIRARLIQETAPTITGRNRRQ